MRLSFIAVFLCVIAICSSMSPMQSAAAPTVWSDLTVSFSKPNDANYELPEFQDRITSNVWLTRGTTAGLFNFYEEDFYASESPLGTRWATLLNNPGKTIEAANWRELAFDSWIDAYGGTGSRELPANLLANNAVVHLVDDDIYLDLQFTSWTMSGGGGFAYIRSAAVPEPSLAAAAIASALALTTRRRRAN
jgi:hypothetical protein